MPGWLKTMIENGKVKPDITPHLKLMKFISGNAYWICLFIGLAGLIAYIIGFKKGGKVSLLSIVIYWIIAALTSL